MSAFLLSDEEFQLISDWLYMQSCSRQGSHAHCIRTFIGLEPGSNEHAFATEEQLNERVETVVRNFYNLNRLALVTRYGFEYDRNDYKQFKPKYNPLAVERKAIEALQSLHYQCAEYITCDTTWHKALKALIGDLCVNIFRRNS